MQDDGLQRDGFARVLAALRSHGDCRAAKRQRRNGDGNPSGKRRGCRHRNRGRNACGRNRSALIFQQIDGNSQFAAGFTPKRFSHGIGAEPASCGKRSAQCCTENYGDYRNRHYRLDRTFAAFARSHMERECPKIRCGGRGSGSFSRGRSTRYVTKAASTIVTRTATTVYCNCHAASACGSPWYGGT